MLQKIKQIALCALLLAGGAQAQQQQPQIGKETPAQQQKHSGGQTTASVCSSTGAFKPCPPAMNGCKTLVLPGYKGKVKYAQFLHDNSELRFAAADNDDVVLNLPEKKPNTEIPVVELILNN